MIRRTSFDLDEQEWSAQQDFKQSLDMEAKLFPTEICTWGGQGEIELDGQGKIEFAGLPDGQDDRFFSDESGKQLGQLGEKIQLEEAKKLSLTDKWLGLQLSLELDSNATLWAYPVQAVSQSESGFELVHQAVCVQPSWAIRGDVTGRWSSRMKLKLQTDAARHFSGNEEAVAAH